MSLTAHRGEILHFISDPLKDGDRSWQYFKDGMLVLEEGYVIDIDHAEAAARRFPGLETVYAHGKGLITPGFVDTHIHYPQCEVIAAYGTQLLDWLETHTFPAERRFEDIEHGENTAEFFLNELLRNGTTTALVFGTVHPQSVLGGVKTKSTHGLR